jgi:hypothetical protein
VRRAWCRLGRHEQSLKLTESRVLEAGDLTATLLRIAVSWMVGFWGTLSTLKGVKAGAHAAHKRESHVKSDEQLGGRHAPLGVI